MSGDIRSRLAGIRRFDQLLAFLRDELGWPIDKVEWDELTFDYTPEELGIDASNAAKIQEIRRLRPLTPSQPWGVFFIKFEPRRLPVVALRRILSQVAVRKRPASNPSERIVWNPGDILFVSNYGEGDQRTISFAHFSQSSDPRDLPTLQVLGWNNLDTPLHLDGVADDLVRSLSWPSSERDVDSWRAKWSSAFTLANREVVSTSKELSIQLAQLARAIHDRARTALSIETERGPLTRLLTAFREALVHDLSPDDFADMYAQTIAYGLLSARISNPSSKTPDELVANLRTSPFLRDLMATFLRAGGRGGRAGGVGLDFDELGTGEVVRLLDSANMPAILRDFGDRNPDEDPVIHFYELFLTEYDAPKRMQRGVFYTPRPVVSYIVRSVDAMLRSEFGLADGLADVTSWEEVAAHLRIPSLPAGVKPDQPFVQILDPATGTGTFLVETVEVIHETLENKWRSQGKSQEDIVRLWNEYVPKHLLTRLHGYELLMAPYAIAHVKLSLKLHETGYAFGSDEPARVFLTNSLEPPSDVGQQTLERMFAALATEAKAVNAIKRNRRFTVIVGNPPYSGHSLNNQIPSIVDLVYDYKRGFPDLQKPGQAKWLQDDYVKFLRFAESRVVQSGLGVVGFITNHAWLDNPTFKGMRKHILESFARVKVVDLHGNANKREKAPDGSPDENVFEIKQGVAISLLARFPLPPQSSGTIAERGDLLGTATHKYDILWRVDSKSIPTETVHPQPPDYLLTQVDTGLRSEFESFVSLPTIFGIVGDPAPGIVTTQDEFAISFSAKEQEEKVEQLLASRSEAQAREIFTLCSQYQWNYDEAKRALRRIDWRKEIVPILYRPFDKRFTVYDRHVAVHRRERVSRHLLDGRNLGLISVRQVAEGVFNHAFVCDTIVESRITVSNKGIGFVLPLWLLPEEPSAGRTVNLVPSFVESIASSTGLRWNPTAQGQAGRATALRERGRGDLDQDFGPRDVFDYIYAVLHSQRYRDRYASFLKSDFARVPDSPSKEVFCNLIPCGRELVGLHLLDVSTLPKNLPKYEGPRGPTVARVTWDDNSVWLDTPHRGRGPSERAILGRFEDVSSEVWGFHMAGYQVCDKWLKERRDRRLSSQEVGTYQRVLAAVRETLRVMSDIDSVINTAGSWPGAFPLRASSDDRLGDRAVPKNRDLRDFDSST